MMLQPGTRVYNTLANQDGKTVSQAYLPDNGSHELVVDVVYDSPKFGGKRFTVASRHLVAESSVR